MNKYWLFITILAIFVNNLFSYDVNIVILTLKENGKLETLIRKYWNNIECSDKEDGGDDDSGDSVEKVRVKSNRHYKRVIEDFDYAIAIIIY